MWITILFFNCISFCLVVTLNSEEVFNSVINNLTQKSGCTTNVELVTEYMKGLENNSLEIKTPRYMKNDMNKYLWKSEF